MATPLRFAVCNEIFRQLPFAEACVQIRQSGFKGIEIAPFTLGANAAALTPEERSEIRRTVERAGLEFAGLHWLLVSPEGLHATTADRDIRKQTWDFIGDLIDLCADLRHSTDQEGGVLVFGSPRQRSAIPPAGPAEAVEILTEELCRIAKRAEARGVEFLLEPLSADQTDVVNSLSQAVSIVKAVASPAIGAMFDVHNAIDEVQPHTQLIHDYLPYIKHVHVNEMDGREPGSGEYDFGSLLRSLAGLNYQGWISLEIFDFSRDGREVASEALQYLEGALHSEKQYQSI